MHSSRRACARCPSSITGCISVSRHVRPAKLIPTGEGVIEPPTSQPIGHIKPLTADDVPSLRRLATEIWHAHYARIISSAQIEYMLEQRYNEALVQSELGRQDLWWDKLLV